MTKHIEALGTKQRTLAKVVATVVLFTPGISSATGQLEEVIVTAQKREEGLQSVPISVQAFTGGGLKLAGVDNSIDLQIVTPGLQTARLAGGWVPRIRGIGSTDTSPGNESSVSTYIDGVYISGSFAGLLSLNNVERIEVLKGPQGTLFGRNATGGLINVITKDPQQELGGNLELSYGNYDDKVINGYATTGVTDTIATDLAVRWEDRGDGWGTNLGTGNDTFVDKEVVVRNKWLFELGDSTEITLEGNYFDFDRDTTNFYYRQKHRYDYDHNLDDNYKAHGWGSSLHINHDFSRASFVSITAYNDVSQGSYSDADYTPAPLQFGKFSSGTETFTQEFQLLSPGDSDLEWILGVFYMDRKAFMDPAGFGLGSLEDRAARLLGNFTQQDTESWAVFAQGTYPILENLDLTLGARYTQDQLKYEGKSLGFAPFPGDTDPTLVFGPDRDKADMDEPTYRVVLDYEFTPSVMAYGSVSTGFKSGTFTILSVPGPVADPEKLLAYEIGFKSELLDHRLRLNAAAYYYDFKDFQSLEVLGIQSQLINAGKATVKGLEMEVVALPTLNWTLKAGFNYMPTAKYDEFRGCPGPIPGDLSDDCSGARIIGSPDWDVSLNSEYTIPSSVGDFDLVLTYQYMSKFPWDADHGEFPVLEEGSRSLLNLRARWTSINGGLYLDAWGKNVTDEEYLVFGTNANGQGARILDGAPRTYGVTLGYNF